MPGSMKRTCIGVRTLLTTAPLLPGTALSWWVTRRRSWIHFTAQRRGEPMEERIMRHNRDFGGSYSRWFEAVFKDKYEYMGEFDLMSLAFTLDLGFYYLGIASQPFKLGPKAFLVPPFSEPISRPFFHLMRTYNRRFAQIARRRRRLKTLGRSNRF